MTSFQEKVYPVRKSRRNSCREKKLKFSNGVYQVVKEIPKGKVMSYKEVAKRAGFPRAWRAVGNALKKNRDIGIPCHRVIKSDGKIGGYRGGVENKIKLLKKEGVVINPFGKFRVNPEHRRRIKYGKITSRFRK